MAKNIRSIKNTLCDDETLGACSRDARLLFVGLITRVDDHGRFRSHAALVRGQVFPYDDDLSIADVERLLQELASRSRIVLYDVDGQRYGAMTNFARHQRVDNAAKSDLPEPPSAGCGELPQPSEEVIHSPETPSDVIHSPVDSEPPSVVDGPPNVDAECNPQTAADCGELRLEGKGRDRKGTLSAAADERPQPAAERERADELLDALTAECGIDPAKIPKTTTRHYRTIAVELVAVGATVDEVRERATTARQTWRDGRLTPDALHKRWAELGPLATVNGHALARCGVCGSTDHPGAACLLEPEDQDHSA